jgi:hypothetical protein
MKNLIQSSVAWFKGMKAPLVNQSVDKATQEATLMAPSAEAKTYPMYPLVTENRPVEKRPRAKRVMTEPEPISRPERLPEILLKGTELTLVFKGTVVYGNCPTCNSTWNLRERIMRRRLSLVSEATGLTCPRCDEAVALPASFDLGKFC